jgi:hypothetical protein
MKVYYNVHKFMPNNRYIQEIKYHTWKVLSETETQSNSNKQEKFASKRNFPTYTKQFHTVFREQCNKNWFQIYIILKIFNISKHR